jgi:hypothetical protein
MQIRTGTEWDIRQGKGGLVLSTARKLKLELSVISDRGKGFFIANSTQIETGTECDVRRGACFVLSKSFKLKLELSATLLRESGFYVVKIMQIETLTVCDIRQGERLFQYRQHAIETGA